MPDDGFLRSLVDNRNQIQSALYKLYEVLTKNDALTSSPKGQLLVGIGFSLWRAVFLAESNRDWAVAGTKAKDFLRHVIATNAVSFDTERKHLDWSFGYYLGGAQYRIWHINDLFQKEGEHRLDVLAQKIRDDDAATGGANMTAWETAFDAFNRAIDLAKGD